MGVRAAVDHPRDALAWHGVSAVCMVVMLVATLPGWFSGAGLAVFAAGVGWCLLQIRRQQDRGAYVRLAVCCTAMVLMLVPGQSAHPAMAARMGGRSMGTGVSSPALRALVVLALLGVAGIGLRAVVRAQPRLGARAAPLIETTSAVLMAVMLVASG